MDDLTIARWRMHTLRLAGEPFASPTAAVGGLLGVQAENHPQASWAVAARTRGATEDEFQRLFDAGQILRTHVLRPTWHFVLPADIRWLVELTGPRIRPQLRQVQRSAGIDDAMLEHSAAVIVDVLSGGTHLTRDELAARLRDAGITTDNGRLGVHVYHAETAALICSGAMKGTDHTYALLDERAPAAPRLDRDEAVAELVRRYFTGHGPATERDLSYWASMTLTDIRAGLAAAGDQLDRVEHDGRTFWFADPPLSTDPALNPRAHLLQILDEYHNGYQDSRGVLDIAGIVPPGRPANLGMALVDAQMVGGMRRTLRTGHVSFDINLFRDLDPDEHAALQAAAARYADFLGRDTTLTDVERT
ncbi:MAG TPA: winged helix DNA-binding domain-containing protein [Euzebyales bacterium]